MSSLPYFNHNEKQIITNIIGIIIANNTQMLKLLLAFTKYHSGNSNLMSIHSHGFNVLK
jgi:hypothetical protein